jgi:hypothetical protein
MEARSLIVIVAAWAGNKAERKSPSARYRACQLTFPVAEFCHESGSKPSGASLR